MIPDEHRAALMDYRRRVLHALDLEVDGAGPEDSPLDRANDRAVVRCIDAVRQVPLVPEAK